MTIAMFTFSISINRLTIEVGWLKEDNKYKVGEKKTDNKSAISTSSSFCLICLCIETLFSYFMHYVCIQLFYLFLKLVEYLFYTLEFLQRIKIIRECLKVFKNGFHNIILDKLSWQVNNLHNYSKFVLLYI